MPLIKEGSARVVAENDLRLPPRRFFPLALTPGSFPADMVDCLPGLMSITRGLRGSGRRGVLDWPSPTVAGPTTNEVRPDAGLSEGRAFPGSRSVGMRDRPLRDQPQPGQAFNRCFWVPHRGQLSRSIPAPTDRRPCAWILVHFSHHSRRIREN